MINQERAKTNDLYPGIPGLDEVMPEGIPKLSINIIAGQPGSGKTIFTQQILFNNASSDNKALYLTTLSEPSVKMLHYLQKFSFFDSDKVGNEILYLDIGEVIRKEGLIDSIDLILTNVKEYKPALVAIDSFKAIHDMAKDYVEVRKFGYDLSVTLTTWGITAFFIGEYTPKEVAEEPVFAIADGIYRLHYQQHGLHYQRYLDIQKQRGKSYFTGLHPFTIANEGIRVFPRITTPTIFPDYEMPKDRVSTGLAVLDDMIDSGLPRGTATMIAGGAGTGKTLLGLHFITSGTEIGEPGVIVTFQENPVQLREIAKTFGWDFTDLIEKGLLIHLYHSPVEIQPDIHASRVKDAVKKIGARRVLIDSIKDIEIATPDKVRYKDYIYSLVNYFKMNDVTVMLTNEIPELFGPFSLSEYGISFIADNVFLLRYVELRGKMSRALSIMKIRGSKHNKEIREFKITDNGLAIGKATKTLRGVLSGNPTFIDDISAAHLPPSSLYILETLKRMGSKTFAEMQTHIHLTPDFLVRELDDLREQGLIVVFNKQGLEHYKYSKGY